MSQQAQLDQVALYIKQLKERVEELKVKRSLAMGDKIGTNTNNIRDTTDGSYLGFPVVFELRDLGSSLEVTLISGLKKNFVLNEVISVLQDEGADVVSVHFSTIGDKVFHTLHAQVGYFIFFVFFVFGLSSHLIKGKFVHFDLSLCLQSSLILIALANPLYFSSSVNMIFFIHELFN